MKRISLLVAASFTSALFIHFYANKNASSQINYYTSSKAKAISYKNQFAFGCSPDLASFNLADSANIIPLLTGWGNYRMQVTVNNDSANIFFQQGINMYYGFHIIEALASFERAVKFDEKFAMGHWGKALAYGPNINDLGYAASPDALASVEKAKQFSANCTPVEKALIAAMAVRYSADSTQTRLVLDQLYADAMKKVHGDFPSSADAAALYVDALMVQHPWDLYDRFYKPKAWTPEIVRVLEGVVKKFPENPGASHYYIHAIEGSEHPERGLDVADRLGGMMPGLSHLVHMPSHIYIRSGYYKKGVEVNEAAVNQYQNYLGKYPAVATNNFLYVVHNLHMQTSCASMAVRYAEAKRTAEATQKSFDINWQDAGGFFGMYAQYLYMTPFLTEIRFGKWETVLNTPALPASHVYANIIRHYGRGLAFARRQQFADAKSALQQMRDSMQNPQLQDHPPAFNPGILPLQVAEKILEGVIMEEMGTMDKAIELFKEAVHNEDGMLYNEPRDWPHPARQYLGNALLKAKKYEEAEKVFIEDLAINPNNGWSFTGLREAQIKLRKTKEVNDTKDKLKKAMQDSDVKITTAVF